MTPISTSPFSGDSRGISPVDALQDAVTLAAYDALQVGLHPLWRANRNAFIRRSDDYERWLEAELSAS